MYAISVENQFLDLGRTALNITMINPIFDRDSILRIYSYPFNLEATPRNKHVFKHADRLDSVVSQDKYEAKLYLCNQLFEIGVLSITSTTERSFRLVFKSKALELLEELKLLTLSDLDWPFSLEYDYAFNYWFDLHITSSEIDYQAIQINEHIFQVPAGDHQSLIDAINAVYPGMAVSVEQAGLFFSMILTSPDPSIPFYINTRPEVENAAFFDLWDNVNFSTDPASVKVQEAWSNHLETILANPQSHVFPVIKNEGFWGDREEFATGPVSFFGHLNYYGPDEKYHFNTEPQVQKNWRYSVVPIPFLKATMDRMTNQSSIDAFGGSFYEDLEIQQLLIPGNRTLDHLVQENFDGDAQTGWLNVWKLAYNLSDHLPATSVYDLLLDLSSTFCLVYDYQDGHFVMDTCRERLSTPVEDWTHLAEAAYKQTTKIGKGYILDYNRDEEENPPAGQLEQIEQSDTPSEAQEFVSNFFSYYSERAIDLPSFVRTWTLPRIFEEGTSDAIGMKNQAAKRLLFYRGLQSDVAGNLYPFASAYTQDSQENEIANYSLDWQGPKGLYEQWWKAYIQLVTKGKPLTKKIRLSINQILELKKFQNIRKRIWHRKGQITGVVKQVQFKAFPDRAQLSVAKVDFITQ